MTDDTSPQQSSPENNREVAARLRRAEAIIARLVKEGAAYQKTIDKITDAWGKDKEQALKAAQSILDQEGEVLDSDPQFIAKSQVRAREMIQPKTKSSPPSGGLKSSGP